MEMAGSKVALSNMEEKIEIVDRHEYFCAKISEYKLNMFRLAKSILRNDSDAEDAVSETILTAYDKMHTLRNIHSFKTWIMRILVNESYTLSNKRKWVVYLEDVEVLENMVQNDDNDLWNVVEKLDEDFRTVTILFYYEDLSIKEICKILNLPMGTVKSRLFRARTKLKELLNYEGGM